MKRKNKSMKKEDSQMEVKYKEKDSAEGGKGAK